MLCRTRSFPAGNEAAVVKALELQMRSDPEAVLCDIAPQSNLSPSSLWSLQWKFLSTAPRIQGRLRPLLFGRDSTILQVVSGTLPPPSVPSSVTSLLVILQRHGECGEALLTDFMYRTITTATPRERETIVRVASRLYGDENVVLLRCDVTMHLLVMACLRTTTRGQSLTERLLIRILDGNHSHLVSHCPSLLSFLHHALKEGIMLGLVERLLEKAGTAVVVALHRSTQKTKANETIALLADRFYPLLYGIWPDLARRFASEPMARPKRTRRSTSTCPILLEETRDPVLGSDGFVYDRNAIMTYLCRGNNTSPMTREVVSTTLVSI